MSSRSRPGYASRISPSVIPSATIPTTVATGIRKPRIHGSPSNCLGLTVIRVNFIFQFLFGLSLVKRAFILSLVSRTMSMSHLTGSTKTSLSRFQLRVRAWITRRGRRDSTRALFYLARAIPERPFLEAHHSSHLFRERQCGQLVAARFLRSEKPGDFRFQGVHCFHFRSRPWRYGFAAKSLT